MSSSSSSSFPSSALALMPTDRFSVLTLRSDPALTKAKATATATATLSSLATPPLPHSSSSSSLEGKPNDQKSGGKKKKKKGGGGMVDTGNGETLNKQQQKQQQTKEWTTELQSDYDRIRSVGEECVSEEELRSLLLAKGRGSDHDTGFNLYDGFEPSGRMHIAQGVFKAMNVNKCTFPGTNSTFVFWVADWFALMNDKMGGDLSKIRVVGQYLIEVWKAAGMDLTNVEFKWASEEITNRAVTYWPTMLDVARRFNVTRIKKCCQIMGRLEGSLTSAQVLYPLMQCTDVFFLKADVCQLGVDQRKVNMLAREYCDAAGIKRKPVILSHHMLYGLKAGQEKMSKSDPDSAVFMEDTPEDVERKIMAAYCPSKEEEVVASSTSGAAAEEDAGKESMHLASDSLKNPCLDYVKHIILCPPDATFEANGNTYKSFDDVRADFVAGSMSEESLKRGLIDSLNRLLDPVRTHFSENDRARGLLEQVRQFKKESATALTSLNEVRRLDLVAADKVPQGCHVVFAPLPSARPTLREAVDVLARIKLAGGAGDDGRRRPTVLVLPDWTARVCNSCDADVKVIDAYYDVLLRSVRCLDDGRGDGGGGGNSTSSSVLVWGEDAMVLKQSEAILSDPSNYWISVINAGRHFMLDDVMGPKMKDSDGVGVVISRLMRVADVLGCSAASVGMPACSSPGTGGGGGEEENDDDAAAVSAAADVEASLICRYYDERLAGIAALSRPDVRRGDGPAVAPLQKRDSGAPPTDNDEYFLLDEPKREGKAKLKKAFCEPGNVDFCPPIDLVAAFGFGGDDGITIRRSAENGGDVTYRNRSEMERDFASGALHPGDLKATASTIVMDVLERIADGIKKDPDAAKAAKVLKAFEKKSSKKKK